MDLELCSLHLMSESFYAGSIRMPSIKTPHSIYKTVKKQVIRLSASQILPLFFPAQALWGSQ